LLCAIASCTYSPEVTRLQTGTELTQELNLTRVERKFRNDVPVTVNFAFNQDTLSEEAMRIVDAQAEWILQYPKIHFSVYGHTDKVGSSEYNAVLGMRRAASVVAHLVSRGINPNRLEVQITFGEDMPMIDTKRREFANRRATTFVSGQFVTVLGDDFLNPSLDVAAEIGETGATRPRGETTPKCHDILDSAYSSNGTFQHQRFRLRYRRYNGGYRRRR